MKLDADATTRIVATATAALRKSGPEDLTWWLRTAAGPGGNLSESFVRTVMEALVSTDVNALSRVEFHRLLLDWDNEDSPRWGKETQPNSLERRWLTYALLKAPQWFIDACDTLMPRYPKLDDPVVIASEHEEWYTPERRSKFTFYWDEYKRYLGGKPGWAPESLPKLERDANRVVELLSDPERAMAYGSKGLVMGYVQSGKTANFTAVIAKAADAGYRLIIVLAGTLDILRDQTQRRLDKELVGWELLRNDYVDQPDEGEFLRHGFRPSERGYFDWERLTGPKFDYRSLKRGIDVLEFPRTDGRKRLNHADNLRHLQARLLVVKKNGTVLRNLIEDFKRLEKTKFDDLPVLIVDDESDQASINTFRTKVGVKKRSAINGLVTELVAKFKRAQYIGYTATPYANVLVSPDDALDLFPKDFIVSLEKPAEYMGVSEFFGDWVADKEEERAASSPYIRTLKGEDSDPQNLLRALDSFVLAGALKLYRQARDASLSFAHHTMLFHTSSRQADHEIDRENAERTYAAAGYRLARGMRRLAVLLQDDFIGVSRRVSPSLPIPSSFKELEPHIIECVNRIERNPRPVLLVNGTEPETPNFEEAPVWRILVGGNKLSRGYTVEGLTTSYFRRGAGAADTLMQMGRWFGFRRGYQDLVRLFVGTDQPFKGGTINLVEEFASICRQEEDFRQELKRYVRSPEGKRITPRQVPPLILSSGAIPPTAGNKMYNAYIADENFGGRMTEPTLAPVDFDAIAANQHGMSKLLRGTSVTRSEWELTIDTERVVSRVLTSTITTQAFAQFLESYRWLGDRPDGIQRQIEFLGKPGHAIRKLLVLTFQSDKSFGDPWLCDGVEFHVRKRSRRASGRFGVYTEPVHVAHARYLVGTTPKDGPKLSSPSEPLVRTRDKGLGVVLFYPVRSARTEPVSMGFAVLYPPNNLGFIRKFSVRRPDERDEAVVDRL